MWIVEAVIDGLIVGFIARLAVNRRGGMGGRRRPGRTRARAGRLDDRPGEAPWPEGAFGDDVEAVGGVRARVIGLAARRIEKTQVHDDRAVAAKDREDSATLDRL